MEKTMSAFEARRQFGKVLDEVGGRGNHVVVERHGEPVAVVIPMTTYQAMCKRRAEAMEEFFKIADAAAAQANMAPGDADALIAEALEAVRAAPES
jgi:prevent-host-death family protein